MLKITERAESDVPGAAIKITERAIQMGSACYLAGVRRTSGSKKVTDVFLTGLLANT